MVHILERTEDVTMLPHTRFNLFMGTILDIGKIFSHLNTQACIPLNLLITH